MFAHYAQAIGIRRRAHEMGSIFGGKLPHPPAYIPGGITSVPHSDHVSKFRTYLAEQLDFIRNVYLPDVEFLASVYDDYLAIGRGYGNLLAYGVFNLDASGTTKLLRSGVACR